MFGISAGWEDLNDFDHLKSDTLYKAMLGEKDDLASAPKEIILDFDATDNPIHGNQEDRFFHGYYDHHCFLPLYVFCKGQLLCAYSRQSNIDGAKHSGATLKLLATYIRKNWPKTKIVLRADSGFCRDKILSWCERSDVGYVVGIARNKRLEKQGSLL